MIVALSWPTAWLVAWSGIVYLDECPMLSILLSFLVVDIGRAGLFLVAVGLACFSSWLPSLLVLFGDAVLF